MAKIIDFKTRKILADLPTTTTVRTAIAEPPCPGLCDNADDALWWITPLTIQHLIDAVHSTGMTMDDYIQHSERKVG